MGEEGMMGGEHTQALVRQEFRGVERLVGAFLLHHTHLHLHDNHLNPGTFSPPCQIIPVKNGTWSDRTALMYGHEQSRMNVNIEKKHRLLTVGIGEVVSGLAWKLEMVQTRCSPLNL
jgi:hypothetical protein